MKNDLIIVSICTSLTSQKTNHFPVNHMPFLFRAFTGRNALCQSGAMDPNLQRAEELVEMFSGGWGSTFLTNLMQVILDQNQRHSG